MGDLDRDAAGRFTTGDEGGKRVDLRDVVLPRPGGTGPTHQADREVPVGVPTQGVAAAVARLQVLPNAQPEREPDKADPWEGRVPHRVTLALNAYNAMALRHRVEDRSWAAPKGESNVARAWAAYRGVALEEAAARGIDIDIPANPPAESEVSA